MSPGPKKASAKKRESSIKKIKKTPVFDWKKCSPKDLKNPALYINRELSWFEFNHRVLEQVYDSKHPLLERVKFFSIVSSNLDEFCMIRLAIILKKIRAGNDSVSPDGLTTLQQFWLIQERVRQLNESQEECWEKLLRPLLAKESIHFLEPNECPPEVENYLSEYFKNQIYPTLTPLAVDPGHPFPHISNLSLNLAVVVNHNDQVKFARVKVPAVLPRFVPIPTELCPEYPKGSYIFAFLEDVMQENIQTLFPNVEIDASYLFRVTRDTDIVIQEDEADDLLESVDRSLKQVRYGSLCSLQVSSQMPQRILDIFAENFRVSEHVIQRTDKRMGFSDWMSLRDLHLPHLKDKPPKTNLLFDDRELDNLFEKIRYQDHFIHHPYESFLSVVDFLKAAAEDPQVVAIKMTLYRIGNNSPIIDYLVQANEYGKQVVVLVELKARFDEKSNIVWAKQLESKGIHVVYGMLNLKTHCKLCLVVRKESDKIRRYAHIGTGNYNPLTAKVYTDVGLFTVDPAIGEDVSEIFNYLTGYSRKSDYQHLLVAPVSLKKQIIHLVEREAAHAKQGKAAHIMIKVNALADPEIIRVLYKASQAGVQIDLIVRGVCCLRPGVDKISKNIRVISIVGRFLEHSRIYYFLNGEEDEVYIGSADLMQRNLDRRVEVLCPILNPKIKNHFKGVILDLIWKDNQCAFELMEDGSYEKRLPKKKEKPINSQLKLLDWYTRYIQARS